VIYRRTVGFKREFRNLPPEIKRAARAKFALFSANWRHPSLHCHKLTGVFWHGHAGGKPLHVVASCDEINRQAFVITAYEPSLDVFESDYRTKKKI